MKRAQLDLGPYQTKAYGNRSAGVEVWLWGRQTGKSYTLAAWAVDRLMTRPGRLVTVLSNSRINGMELNAKCAQVCDQIQQAYEQVDLSPDATFENMNMETRIRFRGKVGRIKILASSPRTARGFSGDLILDEFAFHENSEAIWEAAEPILSANPDYLCRIASTPNGLHNMFYQLVHMAKFPVRKVTRTDAHKFGCEIYHPLTRQLITPEQAREMAPDKKAYDQNYECKFDTISQPLLTYALIDRAHDPAAGIICKDAWTPEALEKVGASRGGFYVGVDVGRKRDMTVVTVVEVHQNLRTVRAILRLQNMRLPQQEEQLAKVCDLPGLRHVKIDATGLGVGLAEYLAQRYSGRIFPVNFASATTLDPKLALSGSDPVSVKTPEALALGLLRAYEDDQIRHPLDMMMREDLRKPERGLTRTGRVTIASTRDEHGHADHFWSLALAIDAAKNPVVKKAYQVVRPWYGPRPQLQPPVFPL